MCGRFAQNLTDIEIMELTKISTITPVFKSRFNIAPSQKVNVIRKGNSKLEFAELTWGLLPAWAKEGSELKPQINARSETANEKPMFRNAFKKMRCVIPISGFYEWDTNKIPHYIKSKDNNPLLIAGLWDKSYMGECFTILTCAPNILMSNIHKRMPVILEANKINSWLDLDDQENLLNPAKDDLLEEYPVSTFVNSPKNDSINCINKA